MKLLNKNVTGLLFSILLFTGYQTFSQESQRGSLNIMVNYFLENNTLPYLMVNVKTKTEGKFKPVSGVALTLFLKNDSISESIGKVVTDGNGEAYSDIPPALKALWNASRDHTFEAVFTGNAHFDSTRSALTVSPARIVLDTAESRQIIATVTGKSETGWIPLKGIDIIIAVKRMDADLSVNEKPTFTTDSLGHATAEFGRDSIFGDSKGNIVLVAKMEDNDPYGNLSIEKTVPWGSAFVPVNNFSERSLFATRNKAPIWLLVIAYSIVILVWGVLLYLILNIYKIKKLSKEF